MRSAAIALLLLSAPILAAGDLAVARKHLERGEKALAAVGKKRGDAKRLKAFQRTKPHFKKARARALTGLKKLKKLKKGKAGKEGKAGELEAVLAKATLRLVGVLNAETILYLKRRAYSQARKSSDEALALLPKDAEAERLAKEIDVPPSDEILAGYSDASFAEAAALRALLRHRTQVSRRYVARRAAPSGRAAAR